MRLMMLIPALALLGCEEPEPPQPSPEFQALQSACASGNLDACATVEDIRARRAAMAAAMLGGVPQYRTTRQEPYMMRPPSRTVCRNSFGQVICETQ